MSHHHCQDEKEGCCHGESQGHHHRGCSHEHHEDYHHLHHYHEGDFAHELLEMADDAWMELLREKIKARIESTTGAHLDKLAAIVSDANHERWTHKLERGHHFDDFKEKVDEFFHKKS